MNRERQTDFDIILWLAIIITVIALATDADAGQPKFTPVAKYQEAAVSIRVEIGGGVQYGSGIYIQSGQLRGVLTVAHIFKCQGKSCAVVGSVVKWKDGTTSKATTFTIDRLGNDIAFIFASNEKFQPIQVSSTVPAKGQVVEFLTYGDPGVIGKNENKLRHFPGRILGVGRSNFQCNTPVIQGDSGGGILTWPAHELIGIQSGGQPEANGQAFARLGTRSVYRRSEIVGPAPIRAFLARIAQNAKRGKYPNTQYCYPCQQPRQRQFGIFNRQQIIQPQQYQPPQIGGAELWPDDDFPELNEPAPEPVTPAQPQPIPATDYGSAIQALTEQLNALEARVSGLPAPTPPADLAPLTNEINRLQGELNTLKSGPNKPITVQILDESGKVIQTKTYPAGSPIRLMGIYRIVNPKEEK